MSTSEVNKMKVADLKRELKLRGLVTTGNKTELQDRLQSALLDGDISLEDTVMSGEDLLDEDGELTEEDEAKILGADENDLLKSPNIAPPNMLPKLKSASAQGNDLMESTVATPKKIILKRKSSITAITQTTKENDSPAAAKVSAHVPITVGNSDKKPGVVTKVSQLSLQERLELRAKKFGVSAANSEASADKSDAIASSTPRTANVTDEKQIETLKKRAERFGCVVSSKIAKLDVEEKKIKRKERFGTAGTTATNNSSSSVGSTGAWADKARQRLERFKTASSVTTTSADEN